MTVLDRIKSFFKPVAKIAEEKPPEVAEEKAAEAAEKEPREATREKPAKTTKPQKETPKATGKKGCKT